MSMRPEMSIEKSEEDLARRAYFIALERHARGEAEDPLRDWLEAEREWAAERARKPRAESGMRTGSGILVAGLVALGVLAYRFWGGRSNP